MVKEPVLVIMAAGLGSRYGGLKQIDPVDKEGHIMMEFSIYDAIKAGFEKVIFIIKKDFEKDFKKVIGTRMSKHIEIEYVYQDLENIPAGYKIPEGRKKPWGTGHAALSCMDIINGPFAVLNADDYYGAEAFRLIYNYLTTNGEKDKYDYTMVGYQLEKTLTDNGSVARGVCETDENDCLVDITERTQIVKKENGPAYTIDGENWIHIPGNSIASMNFWGFRKSIFKELEKGFTDFLEDCLQNDPLEAEYFLPSIVDKLLKSDKARVYVSQSKDKWYGVTYKEDKKVVTNALENFKRQGKYPEMLWEGNDD